MVFYYNWYSVKKKKKTMWFIGFDVEQETSAPPPKKILDPPLAFHISSYEHCIPFLNLWNEVNKQYYRSIKCIGSAIFYTLMVKVGTHFGQSPYYNLHPAMDHYIIGSTLPDLLLISFFKYVRTY